MSECKPNGNFTIDITRTDWIAGIFGALVLTIAVHWLNPMDIKQYVDPYIRMAEQPFHYQTPPYGTRILTPLLVHFLPFSTHTGFQIITFFGCWLAGIGLYFLMRLVSVHWIACVLMLAGYYFSPTIQTLFERPWYIDPMSHWLLLVVFFGALLRNYGVTMAGLTVGAFNRPTSLTAASLSAVVWWDRKKPLSSLLPVIACAVPGALIFLSIRYIWPEVSDYRILFGYTETTQYETIEIQNFFSQHGFQILFSPQIYREILPYLWGPALLGLYIAPLRIRILCLLHILLSALPLIVANDFFRLPFYAFPAIFLLAAYGMRRLQGFGIPWVYGVLAICGIHLWLFPHTIWLGIVLGGVLIGVSRSKRR